MSATFRNDLLAAHERLAALEAENRELKKWRCGPPMPARAKWMQSWMREDWVFWALVVGVSALRGIQWVLSQVMW